MAITTITNTMPPHILKHPRLAPCHLIPFPCFLKLRSPRLYAANVYQHVHILPVISRLKKVHVHGRWANNGASADVSHAMCGDDREPKSAERSLPTDCPGF
jgi:hypothetical protein